MKTKFVSSAVKGFLRTRPIPGGPVDACSQSCEEIDIGSPWLDVCVFIEINRSINKLARRLWNQGWAYTIISVKGASSGQAQLDGCVVWS